MPTPVRYGVGERDFLHGVWFGPQEPTALRDAVVGVHAFNGLIASIYAAAGNPVTEVEDALSTSDDGDADGAATASRTTWSRCAPGRGAVRHCRARPQFTQARPATAVIAPAFVAVLP